VGDSDGNLRKLIFAEQLVLITASQLSEGIAVAQDLTPRWRVVSNSRQTHHKQVLERRGNIDHTYPDAVIASIKPEKEDSEQGRTDEG